MCPGAEAVLDEQVRHLGARSHCRFSEGISKNRTQIPIIYRFCLFFSSPLTEVTVGHCPNVTTAPPSSPCSHPVFVTAFVLKREPVLGWPKIRTFAQAFLWEYR